MESRITKGAVLDINNDKKVEDPVLQVLNVKELNAPTDGDARQRYRLIVSDTRHFQRAMLATQLSDLVKEGKIAENCIIRMNDFICNPIHNKRIIVIMNLEVIGQADERFGNPQNVEIQAVERGTGSSLPTAQVSLANMGGGSAQAQSGVSSSTAGTSRKLPIGSTRLPIAALNPFMPKSWMILGRVTTKTDMKHWNNERGSGNLFSFSLLDSEDSEIRVTAFKEEANKWFDVVQPGKTYYLTKGQVKAANRAYSVGHDYEITLVRESEVIPCDEEEAGQIKAMTFSFKPIESIELFKPQQLIDTIGVVSQIGEVASIQTKTGNVIQKRSIYLVDSTQRSVEVVLWGQQADGFRAPVGSVVAVKAGRISEFQGTRSVGILSSSSVVINPDVPESRALEKWLRDVGGLGNVQTRAIAGQGDVQSKRPSERRMIVELLGDGVGKGEKPEYFQVRATITLISHETDPWYKACPEPSCNKKVTEESQGVWFCEKCQKSFQRFERRYVMTAQLNDSTGNTRVSMFNDQAMELLGKSADEMAEIKESDQGMYEQIFQDLLFKPYLFTLRTQLYQNEVRMQVQRFSMVDFRQECAVLLEQIVALEQAQ